MCNINRIETKEQAIAWTNYYLKVGHKNSVTRKQLMNKTGLADRKIRDIISDCKRYVPIVNVQDGKGYYIPDKNDKIDMMEAEKCHKQEVKRFRTIAWTTKGLREFVNAN